MALTLRSWTSHLLYINHEHRTAPVSPELLLDLDDSEVRYLPASIERVIAAKGSIQGVVIQDGQRIDAQRAFIAFGGNEVRSSLAHGLTARVFMRISIFGPILVVN